MSRSRGVLIRQLSIRGHLSRRTDSAQQEGTTIIALEGTPGKAYQARGWELWAPLASLYQAGEYAEVADCLGARMRAVRGVSSAALAARPDPYRVTVTASPM
jgi:hypothetical protein